MRSRFALAGTALLPALLSLAPACARRPADESAPPAAVPAAPAALGAPGSDADLDALERELTESEERLALYLPPPSRLSPQPVEAPASAPAEDAAEESRSERARPAPAKPKADKKEAPPRDAASGAAAPTSAAPEGEREAGASSDCELACRAFASMRRSADRICSITGDADARCSRARTRVDEAAQRIARAECACAAE